MLTGTTRNVERLTHRQRECLRLVARNLQSKEIAAELKLSPETVERHIKAARAVLGGVPRLQAARMLLAFEGTDHSAVNRPMGSALIELPGQSVEAIDADSWHEDRVSFPDLPTAAPFRPEIEGRPDHDLKRWSRLNTAPAILIAMMLVLILLRPVMESFSWLASLIHPYFNK